MGTQERLSAAEIKTRIESIKNGSDQHSLTRQCLAQVVCITDPVSATQVLRSKVVDKLRFQ